MADAGSSGGSDNWLSTPTPANGAGAFPFPQDRKSANCTYPTTISHARILAAYQEWLSTMLTTSGAGGNERVQDPGPPISGGTTSEGIGYGMLITVYMTDKPHFDKLWAYAQAHMSGGLMSWHVDANGNVVDPHSASDADEDMGWALVMADYQWPGGAYRSAATTLIGNIKSQDINGSNNVKDGNYVSNSTHPDYAAPNYYKVFASVTGDSSWNAVYSAEYAQLSSAQNASTGLIPDAIGGGTFGYDACRAPWRVGLDYCWTASPEAKTFLTPMVAEFMQLSQNGAAVNGVKIPMPIGGGGGGNPSGAITGPAAIAAMMSSSNQTFVNNSSTYLYQLINNATLSGSPNYFSGTLGLISFIALSGNFVDYSNPPR